MAQHRWSDKEREIINRYKDQIKGTAKREYPEGRHGPEDDGALVIAITADKKHGTVIISFGKPVEWIGLEPAYVKELVAFLKKQANEISPGTFLE